MQKPTLLFILLFIIGFFTRVPAQELPPLEKVKRARAEASFEQRLQPLKIFNGRAAVTELERVAADYTVLEMDRSVVQELRETAPDNLLIDLPTGERASMSLELVRVDLFSPDFQITESSSNTYAKVDLGLHYRGIANGDENSLVAVSFADGQMMGMVSTAAGNHVVGKLEDGSSDRYVLYNDRELGDPELGECLTPDSGIPYERDEIDDIHFDGRDASNCVNVYLEVDNSIYQSKGGTSGATNYITGLFNQVATLYANENLNVVLSGIYVWNTADPYSGSNAGTHLNRFRQQRPSFNGEIAALVTLEASGGVAYVDVLCSPSFAYSVSGIRNSYETVPTYSWSVNVLAHEMGHNFGSQHTHACVWNGNATAIDGCYGTEGACARPGTPSGGGTIMSYCHLVNGVGIDFTKGFGNQPGALMRNRAYNGSCLSSCGAGGGGGGGGGGPTGGGGGGNGGGGGGGDTNCEDLSIVLKTDNYPTETSFVVRDQAGNEVVRAEGFTAKSATYTIDACIPAGCYTFEIFDSYGDGLCCSWGDGSYTILGNGGEELGSGSEFLRSDTRDFCLNDTNGGGGEDDDGGGDETCAALDFNDNTPVSYGGSQDRGAVTLLDPTTIRLENNSWKAVLMDYTVTPNTVLEFEFGSTQRGEIHGIGFDNNNSISSNRLFQLYGTQNWGIREFRDYDGNEGNWKAYSIPVGQRYTGTFSRLFFSADHDGGARNGNSYFRNVRLYEAGECVAFVPTTAETISDTDEESVPFVAETLLVYPNPAEEVITATFTLPTSGRAGVELFNLQGQRVYEEAYTMEAGPRQFTLPVTQLPVGSYFLRLTTDSGYRATAKVSVLR